MTEQHYRMENTQGYTQQQLDELNEELEMRLESCGHEPGSWMYDEEIKCFDDEVAGR